MHSGVGERGWKCMLSLTPPASVKMVFVGRNILCNLHVNLHKASNNFPFQICQRMQAYCESYLQFSFFFFVPSDRLSQFVSAVDRTEDVTQIAQPMLQ